MAAALLNSRTGKVIATAVEVADTRETRRRGLLGRTSMDAAAAMLLTPCAAVHTAFMGFPIDIVFLDRGGRAVRLVHRLRPWRLAVSLRARTVVELAAGRLAEADIAIGDRLHLAPEVAA